MPMCRKCNTDQPIENYSGYHQGLIAKGRAALCATCVNAAGRANAKVRWAAKREAAILKKHSRSKEKRWNW